MLKKLINWLIAAVIIMAVPAGAAFALPGEQEQMIKQEVIVGYFDIWKGDSWLDTNNDGTPDAPGQTGKLTKPFNYSAADKLNEWQITRVEVTYPFGADEYTTAGGRQYGPDGKPAQMDWEKFKKNYLKYLPQNLTAQIADQNLPAGTASVQWGLDLPSNPIYNALDIKDLKNRQYIGYEPANIGSMVEGWRWYLPAIITWYGIPKDQEQPLPDFSVTLGRHEFKNMNPGDIVTLTATYKLNENHPQPEKAKLGAFHVVGAEYPVELEPLDPKDALDSNGVIEFQPGETKQYKITVTVQNRNSVVQAKVWPADASNDADWSNNRDEAQIKLNQNLWVELVGGTELETREGNSINVTATIHNDSGSMVVTRLVWMLDGKVIRDIKNYDVISQENNSVTVDAGVGLHAVTVEVNPDRDKPANESTYDDNKATCGVNVIPVQEKVTSDIKIIGPDTWEALKPYPFRVQISGYLPYEKYTVTKHRANGSTYKVTRYRSKTYKMNVKTHGEGVLTIEWTPTNEFGNPQKTIPVLKSWSENYSESSGSFTRTYNYEFPIVGMRGQSKSNLVIEATDSRAGTARKVVTITPAPVNRPSLKLTL
ncbi:hypothetical protein [Desulfotruncus alcoholivorax]|uniref:hypothetical protein n=1 Tax=Desulfotruncus alcoholivorax TaxID=265477 RepID=UPI0003FCEC46|nr:hypothetical protein [Desulfotruncus alcoholivorax]